MILPIGSYICLAASCFLAFPFGESVNEVDDRGQNERRSKARNDFNVKDLSRRFQRHSPQRGKQDNQVLKENGNTLKKSPYKLIIYSFEYDFAKRYFL